MNDEFNIDHEAIDSLNEMNAREILRDSINEAAQYIIRTNDRICDEIMNQFEFQGDDDDYRPAASSIMNRIINDLHYHEFDDAISLIKSLFNDDEFCNDLMTCDFDSSLHQFIDYRE